jgi:soluble lytic murein transglycosylase-like protein
MTIYQGNTLLGVSPLTHQNQHIRALVVEDDIDYGNTYYSLISQYDWNVDLMYKIMLCESSGNKRAVGDRDTAYYSYGLLQIRNLPSRNYTIEELFDPARNVEIGYEIWQNQGYGAWYNCWRKLVLSNV